MASIRPFARRTAALALLAAIVAATPAGAVSIDVGSYSNFGIGSEYPSSFDNFSIAGDKISIANPTTPILVALGQYTFDVGPNCSSCSLTPSFDALVDVKVGGSTQQLDLRYSWSSDGQSDFLSFATPAPLLFDFGNARMLIIAFESLGVLSSSGATLHGNLNAMVSTAPVATTSPVPEPQSYALLLAGLGVIGLVARRRS